jgi:hypothetical protein
MIVGDPSRFAIESEISCAFEPLSHRALGYFVIHVGGRQYGVRSSDATMMACSIDEVSERMTHRGNHIAPFAKDLDAGRIADAIYSAIYAKNPSDAYFQLPLNEFHDLIYTNKLIWAPDGDEAFDDGSYVLQFDDNDRVRLIAFSLNDVGIDPTTLRDEWLAANDFYRTLERWHSGIEDQLRTMPKTPLN